MRIIKFFKLGYKSNNNFLEIKLDKDKNEFDEIIEKVKKEEEVYFYDGINYYILLNNCICEKCFFYYKCDGCSISDLIKKTDSKLLKEKLYNSIFAKRELYQIMFSEKNQ